MPKAARGTDRHTLPNQLRDLIESRGLTAYGLGLIAGVDPGVISRFLSGERDIRLETAGRIASALGLRLVEVGRGTRGRTATTRYKADPPRVAPSPDDATGCDEPCGPTDTGNAETDAEATGTAPPR